MRWSPLSDALGIELVDFDIKKSLNLQEQAELRQLFTDHHLILVRGQEPTNDEHNRFVENFGLLSLLIGEDGDAGYISNKGAGLFGTGADDELIWHADGTYGPQPGIATSLLAREVAPDSAPTMFANAVHALENLPAELRARIEPLHAVHARDTQIQAKSEAFRADGPVNNAAPVRVRTYQHPIIYKPPHLETPVLYVNQLLTSHIAGLPLEEGEALREELYEYLYAADNTYTHYWQPNDIVIWDNIALQHRRPKATSNTPRHLRRISLDGWKTADGMMEWFATGGKRELARASERAA